MMDVCLAILTVFRHVWKIVTWPLDVILYCLIDVFAKCRCLFVPGPLECSYGCANRIEQLQESCAGLEAELLRLMEAPNTRSLAMEQTLSDTSYQLNQALDSVSEQKRHIDTLQQQKQTLEKRLSEAEKHKDEALMRLSEIMSSRLRDNNPRVADLSDLNRPTKLAEQYSELYDNEWTSAYSYLDETAGLEEEQAIRCLLDIIMQSYTFCHDLTTKCWEMTSQQIFWDLDEELEQDVRRWLKKTRKENALSLLPKVQKDVLAALKDSGNEYVSKGKMKKYIKACTRICWLMAVQDPPVVMVCPGWLLEQDVNKVSDTEGKTFDVESKPADSEQNTLQGKDGNDLNIKGNGLDAQRNALGTETKGNGLDTGDAKCNKLETEKALKTEENASSTEVEGETAAIAASTGTPTEDQAVRRISFDRNQFKDYTKRGRYIDFVVWPQLLLHENGPQLCKGVAQGCN